MATTDAVSAIQACLSNRLDPGIIQKRRIAGVIGATPSRYSKSPALWNAAFDSLRINAVYLPFDVTETSLKDLVSALRNSDRALGVNVTIPHKVKIMEHLDELETGAARIRAVNTVVRTETGRLIGYNTDGEGFIESLLKIQPSQTEAFIESLKDLDVLLLGAGGSARAVAYHLADQLGRGHLVICNRTMEPAEAVAHELRKIGYKALAIREQELPHWAARVGLIINCTIKGQGGIQRRSDGKLISLESYSAIAPAQPVAVPEHGRTDSQEGAIEASQADIQKNNEASLALANSLPKAVRFYDLIYFPEETVFLRHGRETGHRIQNGKAMIINQAVIAFCTRICRAELQARGIDTPETFRHVLEVMYRAW
jgi:shikimate dehydrogenase